MPAVNWDAVLARLLHPTQAAILEAHAWIEEPLSPSDLTRIFNREWSLGQISYHVKRLTDLDLLVKVGTRQVRGARENFYVLRQGVS